MLGSKAAVATVAVRDLKAARGFYEAKLGLEKVATEGDEVVVYKTGSATLLVYRSDFAGTNKATCVTWSVGDELSNVVQALRSKGVAFEHYDMPGMTREGDIHSGGSLKVAWFKDPDGNIHNLNNGS